MARDSYTYLHLPMIAGIVVFAIGVERTLPHIDAHLQSVVAAALCGGPALYLVALSAFKRRNLGSFNRPRLVVACILVALIPVATTNPRSRRARDRHSGGVWTHRVRVRPLFGGTRAHPSRHSTVIKQAPVSLAEGAPAAACDAFEDPFERC